MPDSRSDERPPTAQPSRHDGSRTKSETEVDSLRPRKFFFRETTSSSNNKQANMERQPIQSTDNAAAKTEREPSYGDLLHFSRGWHLLWLLPLLLAALATAAVVPTQAFILGQLTQLLGSFVPGSQTATNFENDVSKWIHILVEFGAAACFLFCTSFAGWQTFGDFQVHRVYTSLFDRMLQHEIEWFDKRQDGVASLVTRTQS